jgi:iron complex outermembrane receptor protein
MSVAQRPRPLPARRRKRADRLALAALLLPPIAAPCQPSADGAAAIEQLIVTARKLPEDISRVPLSVQALPGAFLDDRDLTSLYDLQFDIPGFAATNRGMNGAGFALRGVTDEGGGTLSVAPHINGIYLGRSNLALARLFDVERVEVVKGPQGTLYGRNATGGSINVVTRVPGDELAAGVEGAFGSFETTRVRGHVNVPAENLAVRVAVAGSEGDGFIRNSIDDRRFAEEDYLGVRASLRAMPTDALTIDVMAQRVEDDGASSELWLPRKDFLPDPDDIWLTTVTLADPYLESTDDVASVELAYELDELTLRSISGYARNVTNALDDCAGIPQLRGCVRGVRPLHSEQRSQELRLESVGNDSFDWLAGVFYFNGDQTYRSHLSVAAIGPAPVNDFTATSGETAYAIFGDATRALGARWSASGGLRFSREKNRVAEVGTGTADNPALTTSEGSWDDTSWRLGLEYSRSDRMLVYANVSTGFKSGGATNDLLPNGEFDSYEPEDLLAYEAGISATLPGQRSTVRASAFYYDFEDMQVQTVALLANRVATVIDNAGAARIYGLDVSSTTRVSDRVTFSGALVFMPKREFVEFVAASSGADVSGNTISRAPEWSVSVSVGYRVPIGTFGELTTEIDYNYRSEFFFTKENTAILSQEPFGLLNLAVRFESAADRWYVFASARNALDAEYFNQVFLQSAPGSPASYEVGLGLRF